MINTILFPSDFIDHNIVDYDLLQEYNAAIQNGFGVILFNYDLWYTEEKIKLNKHISSPIYVIYRGWMMKDDVYLNFYNQLKDLNIHLITTPDSYSLMHLFPNAYHLFINDTAKLLLFPLHQQINIKDIHFNKFMIKDYVKSVKGKHFPKYLENTISQEEFNHWMNEFYQYRGNLLTKGICIKEYLNLKYYNSKTNEYRVFYINNKIASISRNSSQDIKCPLPPDNLINKYSSIDSPFYTIDYMELENGEWKIIECGDGQVSGLSDQQDYNKFYKVLYDLVNLDRNI